MERKKIILLASSDVNYDQRLDKVASSLVGFDHEVLLMGRRLKTSIPMDAKVYHHERVKCIINSGAWFYLELNLRFFLKLIGKKFDVVCANDPDTLPAAIALNWFKNFQLVYDSHEYFTEVPELEGKSFKKKIWTCVESKGVKLANQCYTVNESLADILSKKYGKPFKVVKNVPKDSFPSKTRAKENIIIYQGALNHGRGLKLLIRAMDKIDAQLLLAGRGDIEKDLRSLVKDLQLSGKVKFLGVLLPRDLQKTTSRAKIGVNLLEEKSLNYYYSLANKFFDYMHAGIPSIHMNFPEYARINEQSRISLLINTLNETELVEAIQSLLSNDVLYAELVENNQALQSRYTWVKEEKVLRDIYA